MWKQYRNFIITFYLKDFPVIENQCKKSIQKLYVFHLADPIIYKFN